MNLDAKPSTPTTRYWKWLGADDEIRGVFRLKEHMFQKFANGTWQQSDYWERASQDPDFPEINEAEAIQLIDALTRLRDKSTSQKET